VSAVTRRTLLASGVAFLAVRSTAEAQTAEKIPTVGVLRPGNPPPADFGQREAFELGLRHLGWNAAELGGKQLELLREAVPALSRVAVLRIRPRPIGPLRKSSSIRASDHSRALSMTSR
jgi:hypothetical protein